MMMMMPSQPSFNPLPPAPYREQSKTRKRFSRSTPEAVKESLRRRRNREAAQDLRNRKKNYEVALQIRLRELTTDVENLTAEEALLLEEQHRLKQQLSGTTGHPAVLSGTEDSAMDSKAWLTAGPRFTAASQQQTLQSADMETEACTMGSSIEPADEFPCSLWCPDGATDVRQHGNELFGLPTSDDIDLSPADQGRGGDVCVEVGGGVGSTDEWLLEPALELRFAADPDDLLRSWITERGEPAFTSSGRASPPLTPLFDSSDGFVDDDFIAQILGPEATLSF
eukprot:m.43060 g.43060  ORF g.43060 m.43060 type:complete len:282 (+) comp8390_c0_seq1:95-940(+)